MSARREPRPIIAYAKCPICGARCAVFQNTAGRVYGYCQGNDDPGNKACGSDWRFGRTHSENMIRQAKAAAAPASSPAPAAERETHGAPAGPDTDTGKRSDAAPGAKPSGGRSFGILD